MTRSSLLRSSELAPLDLSSGFRELETNNDLFNLVVISPCQTFVSNDPTEEENVERTPCNITSFECVDNSPPPANDEQGSEQSSNMGPSRVTVDFDYELWYTEPDKFNETVVQLESGMLQHLAKVFNLLDCPYVSSSGGSTATSRNTPHRNLQLFGDELADLFVGVDSTPVDEPDLDHQECIVPVMETDKVSAECQAMKGRFSAAVNADITQDSMAEASIKSGLLRLLRLGMNEDLYVSDNVRKVSFIGDRTTYEAPPTVQSSSPSSGGIGTAALAIIILAVLFVFLIVGFLVGRNIRKKKQDHRDKGVVLDESFVLDEEAGDTSYNKGFMGQAPDNQQHGADVQGSLASTDELALQPQSLVAPVLSKSKSDGDAAGEKATSDVVDLDKKENVAASDDKMIDTGDKSTETNDKAATSSTAADELAAVLLAATAAAASAEKAGEKVAGEKQSSGQAEKPTTPPKKKKKRKKGSKRDPDSPDSLLAESLRKLDSIAEEGESSVIDEESAARSLT